MDFAERMSEIDAVIFDVIGDTATIGTSTVKGVFSKQYREIEAGEAGLVGLNLSFDCQYDNVSTLEVGDTVAIDNVDYRFIRFIPDGGDETGKVTLELGRFL